MIRQPAIRAGALALAAVLCIAPLALADGGPNKGREWSGVNTKRGNASPGSGSIHEHSNVDDYTHQDEQVNIDGNKSAVVKVLRANQKNLVNDFVVRTFPIRNASPIEIRNAMRNVTYAEGGRAEVIRDTDKKEYFLFVLAPTFQMPFIEAAMKALDEPWVQDNVDGSKTDYYKAQFRDIETIAEMAAIPASMGDQNDDEDNLYVADTVANAAHVQGEPYRVSSFVKYAKKVDQPIPQVLCKVTVYEVDISNEKKLGLDFMAWKNGPAQTLFNFVYWGTDFAHKAADAPIASVFDPFVSVISSGATVTGNSSGLYSGLNYLLTAEYIDFLEGTGRARVVTSGKILTKNAVTGTLVAADEILHFNVATGGERSLGTPNVRVQSRTVKQAKTTVGLEIKVTPYVAQEITELKIDFSDAGYTTVGGLLPNGAMQLKEHCFVSTVLAKDGQTMCVGGLRINEDVKNTQKIPLLGDLPVIGWLFGHEHTVKRDKAMVVVIDPDVKFGSESDFEMADPQDRKVRDQVKRVAELTLPATQVGFDQWLLGR
jgi:type II secretory pathway component GspD/PulD (secretin)